MHEIKSFKIWQTAAVIAVVQTILAWIEGVLVAMASLRNGHPEQAIFFVIMFPVGFGILGYLLTGLSCWLYNLVAARIGGIAFELTPRGD